MNREEHFKNASPSNDDSIEKLFLRQCTRIYENLSTADLTEAMTQIIQGINDKPVKVVSLIGGAASGKSTLAQNLVETFSRQGIVADSISTDDFVIGDRSYRREHFEGKEPRAKYDFQMMNQVISEVCANADRGTTVAVPTYNPITGVAIAEGAENYQHHIGKVAVLIVEGDFDEVAESNSTFYLHMSDESRLQNRLGRDVKERNEADTEFIRKNFEQRQLTQHVQHTLPAMQRAEYIIDVETGVDGWKYDIYKKDL